MILRLLWGRPEGPATDLVGVDGSMVREAEAPLPEAALVGVATAKALLISSTVRSPESYWWD